MCTGGSRPGRTFTSMNARRPLVSVPFASMVMTWPIYLMVDGTSTSREYAVGVDGLLLSNIHFTSDLVIGNLINRARSTDMLYLLGSVIARPRLPACHSEATRLSSILGRFDCQRVSITPVMDRSICKRLTILPPMSSVLRRLPSSADQCSLLGYVRRMSRAAAAGSEEHPPRTVSGDRDWQ